MCCFRSDLRPPGAIRRDVIQCKLQGWMDYVTFQAVSQTSAANTLLACVLTIDVARCITFLACAVL